MGRYDVVVIGGGHAGAEAALAAARTGAHTLLLTHQFATIGQMSCNPAIGGIGKSHLVKEVDALAGMMALAADDAGIQFRRLNASRGAAVQATRAQCDRILYKTAAQNRIRRQPNLAVAEAAAADITIRNHRAVAVTTESGEQISAAAIVLTAGTFLNGIIHIGARQIPAGRRGCAPSQTLAARLLALGCFRIGRLKTGTPPRLDGKSIDFTRLATQPGDSPRPVFSFVGDAARHPRQVVCHIAQTCPRAHDIVRAALPQSPLYNGDISGAGPRYCPSIEDKVTRFAARESHRIFLEPEGLTTSAYYPNGISTCLPEEAQREFVAAIAGLERARITQFGYAIEYDYFDPRDLAPTLQTRAVSGLFFAGQINGTTGYEEAAAQGVVAGVNAARLCREQPLWSPSRQESYIGVMIDDLTARGVSEPYRMFTSRAECRLSLREDNADLRLTELGRKLNLVDNARYTAFCQRRDRLNRAIQRLEHTPAAATGTATGRTGSCSSPSDAAATVDDAAAVGAVATAATVDDAAATVDDAAATVDDAAATVDDAAAVGAVATAAPPRGLSAADWLKRPHIRYADLRLPPDDSPDAITAAADIAEIEARIKYAGYIRHQQRRLARARDEESMPIPPHLDYAAISGLSAEAQQRLAESCPATIRQARRISGVTPAAITLLTAHLISASRGGQAGRDHPTAARRLNG